MYLRVPDFGQFYHTNSLRHSRQVYMIHTFWVAEKRSTSNHLDNRMYGSLTCTWVLDFPCRGQRGPIKDCTVIMSSLQMTKESVFGFPLFLLFFSRQWPILNVPPALEAIGLATELPVVVQV